MQLNKLRLSGSNIVYNIHNTLINSDGFQKNWVKSFSAIGYSEADFTKKNMLFFYGILN